MPIVNSMAKVCYTIGHEQVNRQRIRLFSNTIIELAELHQWRIYHVAKVKGQLRADTSKGFPDLVLARDYRPAARLVFAELKLEGRRYRPPIRKSGIGILRAACE